MSNELFWYSIEGLEKFGSVEAQRKNKKFLLIQYSTQFILHLQKISQIALYQTFSFANYQKPHND